MREAHKHPITSLELDELDFPIEAFCALISVETGSQLLTWMTHAVTQIAIQVRPGFDSDVTWINPGVC